MHLALRYRGCVCVLVHRARVITRLPSPLKCETAACAFADYVYVVGLGKTSDEIWRYRLTSCAFRASGGGASEWTLCAKLATGRRRHCVAIVGCRLYVLAGIAGNNESTVLDSVEVSTCHIISGPPNGPVLFCLLASAVCRRRL